MEDSLHLTLRDHTSVHARRLAPHDRDRLQDGVSKLSEESRIQRFHAGLSRLSASQLRYLTEVDQQSHLAWGAEDLDHPEQPGIAVVRAIQLLDEPTLAEFALTVADAYHGRGLGTLLLGLIALDARDHGYAGLVGAVRLSNEPMNGLLKKLGATHRAREGATVEFLLDLSDLGAWPESSAVHRLRATLPGWPSG